MEVEGHPHLHFCGVQRRDGSCELLLCTIGAGTPVIVPSHGRLSDEVVTEAHEVRFISQRPAAMGAGLHRLKPTWAGLPACQESDLIAQREVIGL